MLPNPYQLLVLDCGERGIRTPDTLLGYTRFPGERLKPLGHLSFILTVRVAHTRQLRQINQEKNLCPNFALKF